jgi:LytS/YehU family sensor histidine kinase
MSIIFLTIKLFADSIKNRKRFELIERQKLMVELKYLREQNNPHFLFNNMNNIYFLIDDSPQLAKESVLKLSDMLRFQLYISKSDIIPVEKEINYINSYISLQKLRHPDNLNVSFNIEGNPANFSLEPFVLFTFVENAFKHGVSQELNNNNIKIKLNFTDNNIELRIRNSYKQQKQSADDGGFGLQNIRQRLNLLYTEKHSLNISTKDQIFEVNLKIVVNK